MVFDQAGGYLFSGWRGRMVTLFFLLISLAVVVMVIFTNWTTISTYEWQVRPVWIGYGLFFLAIDLFLGALAWHLIVIRFTEHKSLRQNVKNVDWAIWPAGVLLGLALLVYINEVNWIRDDFIFPLLVIVVGVIIIVSGTRKKK